MTGTKDALEKVGMVRTFHALTSRASTRFANETPARRKSHADTQTWLRNAITGLWSKHFSYVLCLVVLLFLKGTLFCETQKSFLWKVQNDHNHVYILGSIHAAEKQLYPLSSVIENAFDSSDVLVVEVNINEIDPLSMTGLVMGSAFYQDGDSLKDHVSQETYDLVTKKLEELGVDLDTLSQSKPWFVAMMISNLELQKLGFNPLYGIDKHFLDQSAEKHKKVLELESFDFQVRLLESFTDEEQELFLSYELKNDDTMQKEVNELMTAWKQGDAAQMEAMMFKPLEENQELMPVYEQLFFQRNVAMAEKIEGYLKTKQSHFVVAGSGHLVGDKGIIALLKKKGYKVEQL
jgi:uncharacterized protein